MPCGRVILAGARGSCRGTVVWLATFLVDSCVRLEKLKAQEMHCGVAGRRLVLLTGKHRDIESEKCRRGFVDVREEPA
jgi:hypothetical protein